MSRKLFALLLAVILIASVASGCGSGNKAADSATSAQAPRTSASRMQVEFSEGMARDDGSYDSAAPAEKPAAADQTEMEMKADSLAGFGSASIDVENVILAERKIIRSAYLTIEVENFDTAFSNIENIILGVGFIQETNINTERVYVEDEMKLVKSGSIVIRVDKTKFDSVINKLRGIGEVFNYTTNGEDVTEQYFDVESRLRLLELEQQKLESYVARLDDLDEIFKAESRLTELRYQIESLTGKLNKLSSLVDLSTITINMYEKRPGYDPKPLTYGDKLLNKMKDSLMNVVEYLGELLLFIVGALPVLVILGFFVLLGVWIFRKITRKTKHDTMVRQPATLPAQKQGGPSPEGVYASGDSTAAKTVKGDGPEKTD